MSEKPMGLRELKKARTRRKIMDVTVELVRERGYQKVTLDEIIRRVEIGPPTFYRYFRSKEAVLGAVGGERLEEFAAHLESAPANGASAEELLRSVFDYVREEMSGDPELWNAIMLAGGLDPIRIPEQQEADIRARQFFTSIIARGQERGEITRDFSASILAGALDTLGYMVCYAALSGYAAAPPLKSGLDAVLDLFFRAATARPEERALRERNLSERTPEARVLD